ncbi:MAG TPA: deoxyribose-phosphate aldolase [Anaerolineaceae bacterium]|jgi:deoxyribose-phosphate aldolase|nr:deoxyribose-phosphate aldolase [Anaerolineaceae bacterium]HOE35408.1 deoxyribose-phosphate aldolase [Anaerolineaceae bacterium]HOT25225.1 deoxyribose-phosphate aldolase [Anaerolineaceae bacterium]HQH57835.1 deoxyribose-phosphate aldolase [Anaerolineaceae bacterium]HQK02925.1 deoxyribose-phosphate aldolase [Anaerolineaceae bacterium]
MSKKSRYQSYEKSADFQGFKVRTRFDKRGHLKEVGVEKDSSAVSSAPGIAALIDHTLLKPESTAEQIAALCAEAAQYHFGAVCVNSCWVAAAAKALQGTGVKVGATIGFPWGTASTAAKVAETRQAIADGAREVDMVLAYGKLKSRDYAAVAEDIREVVRLAHRHDVLVKVILETSMLNQDEKVTACLLARQACADFVKTSTGFQGGGATAEDIALMRAVVGPDMGVKASGGVRSYADAMKMIAAGATRIGTSAGIKIVQEAAGESAASPSGESGY